MKKGVKKLEPFPAWRAHFARIMHREMGANQLLDDPTWVNMDVENVSPPWRSRPSK